MSRPFDELGLWMWLSDLRDGPTRHLVIPVGWPIWKRRRRRVEVGFDPEAPCGELRLRGELHVVVDRTPGGGVDFGWESFTFWEREPGRVEISSITCVLIEGDDIEADLTLWEPGRPRRASAPL